MLISVADFEKTMRELKDVLPEPDENGEYAVTREQIKAVERITKMFFAPLFDKMSEKASVDLDGSVAELTEGDVLDMSIGTTARIGSGMFVRMVKGWLEVYSESVFSSTAVFLKMVAANGDALMTVVTTPR
jgi:hypothetical protein